DRWAWRYSLAQLQVGSLCQAGTRSPSPGHISKAWAPAGDKQYIYDARRPGLFLRRGKEGRTRKEAPQRCGRTSGAKTTSEPGTTGDQPEGGRSHAGEHLGLRPPAKQPQPATNPTAAPARREDTWARHRQRPRRDRH